MKPRLDWREWNFSNVPDVELATCCDWEYMRESATIHTATQTVLKYADPEDRPLKEEAFHRLKEDSEARAAYSLLSCCSIDLGLHCMPLTTPWQAIGERERAVTVKFHHATEWGFTLVTSPAAVGFLYGTVKQMDRHPQRISFFGGEKWIERVETLAVNINWGDFSNRELVTSFGHWVEENRPKNIPEPKRRGRNKRVDLRADLTRLAALRLLSRYTPKELLGTNRVRVRNGRMREERTPAMPECVAVLESKQFSGNQWLEVEKWRDARREARRCFHRLLPFLPKTEEPLSYLRKR